MKRILFSLGLLALLTFLLLSPQTALQCARNGLALWYQNLVPVLLPFMILSNLMIRLNLVAAIAGIVHPVLHLVFGTSIHGSYAILSGFLFGCPMGAKVVHDLLEEQSICQEEAEYLIGFVNNLSPAFVITYLVQESLQSPALLGPTLAILYGAPLISALIFAPKYRKKAAFVSRKKNKASKALPQLELVDACISNGIVTIAQLGGYILLFSLITGMLQVLPLKNKLLLCLLGSLTEITNGIRMLSQCSFPFPLRYLCLICLSAFGGFCALMQTLSVFPMKKQTLRHYLVSKGIIFFIALFFSLIFCQSL